MVIDNAFTVFSGSSIVYYIKANVIGFNENNNLQIEYNYIPLAGNYGEIICEFRDGFYQGIYKEYYNGQRYEGDVWYILTKNIDKRLYIHGEWNVWRSLANARGYDFFVGHF